MCPKHTFRRKSCKCYGEKSNFSMRLEIAGRPTSFGVGEGSNDAWGVASKANRGDALCFHLPGASVIAIEAIVCTPAT
jgi:hypothetical protein